MEKQKPAHTIRLGTIKAVIWANQNEKGVWYNTRVCRLYKDDHDEWHEIDSFSRDDLPLVCKVLDRAHSWIYDRPRPSPNVEEALSQTDRSDAEPAQGD